MIDSKIGDNRKEKFVFILKWFLNAAFFYVGWLVCMHQATGPYPYLGPLVVLAILIYHFFVTKERKADFILCVSLGILGTVVDSLYVAIGMLKYVGGYAGFPSIAPLWITSLWVLYGTSVNHSLGWLRYNVIFAAFMGAGGAISSYLVGEKLDAVKFLWGETSTLAVIGLVWAVVVPVSLICGDSLLKNTQPK